MTSMSETVTLEDRSASLLDAFSAAPHRETAPPVAPSFGLPAERSTGAQQVAVYRDEAAILRKLKALGAAAGDEWFYRYPVKNRKENRTDYIEGPSIKLANDLARIYGNCEVDARVLDAGNEWMIYARFTDIETGFSLTRPFQQRKKQGSIGGGDDARALDIALQIGASKAIRNVVVNALQTFADFAFNEARSALVDKIGRNLEQFRTRVAAKLVDKKIDLKRVEAVVGRVSADWLAPDVAKVIAMVKSIEDGMATLDETFPPLVQKAAEANPASDTKGPTVDEFASTARSADPNEGAKAKGAQQQGPREDDGAAPAQTDEQGEQDPQERIRAEVRSRVMAGEKVVKVLNALGERRALLTDDDVKALKAAEKALSSGAQS